MKKFINFSNHPSSKWGEDQLKEAQAIGEIIDIQFPVVSPTASDTDIYWEARLYASTITKEHGKDIVIHVMGEMTFTHMFVTVMNDIYGIRCVASTTERVAIENPDGTKTASFKFVQFRDYYSYIDMPISQRGITNV